MDIKMGFFEQFYLAITKHKLYKKLTQLKRGQHVVYFLGITFLLTLISYVVPMASFIASLGGYETFFTKKIPAFTIENGELTIENPLDFYLNQIRIVVDDDVEQYTQSDLVSLDEYVVMFSKHNVVTNVSAIPMVLDYEMLGSDVINNESVAAYSGQFYATLVMASIFAWIAQMISYAFWALIFSMCGVGINKMSGANLSFGRLYIVSLYAETVFALTTHLASYFLSGVLAFVVCFVSSFISMRAVHTGIISHV